MSNRRVVITGVGAITALGHNITEFWDSLSAGKPAIGPIEGIDLSLLRFQNGAQVRNYDHKRYFDDKDASLIDRFAQLGAIAAREAILDSGIEFTAESRERTAVITGSCAGGQGSEDEQFVNLYKLANPRVNPFTIPRIMANGAASRISLEYGLVGPTYTVATACSSASHAIGQAFWMLRNGQCDIAVAGGSESIFSLGFLKAWEAMRVVSPDTCRPFSKDRRGLILGEGGAMLVLETLESAQARGARMYAEIAGFGMSSDAHHITQPCPEGAARAIRLAISDGGIDPSQVGYVNAHGTATPVNDAMETQAIRRALGPAAERVAVSSTKSMHGHALGAAGAIEAVATVLALRCGVLPPTANYTTADPACDLDVIANVARRVRVECALSNSFAFGGLNAVLAFRAI